jgi:hypothetical protein
MLAWVTVNLFLLFPLDSAAINSLALLGVAIIGIINTRKLEAVKKTGEATHKLSNSAMGAELQGRVDDAEVISLLFHRIAQLSGNAPGDLEAATAADKKLEQRKKLLNQHLVQQAAVDATP